MADDTAALAKGPTLQVADDHRGVVVTWPDGGRTTAPAPWLFDNAEDAFDSVSGHRLTRALALRGATTVLAAKVEGDAIVVRFGSNEVRRVPLAALSRQAADANPQPELWLTADWAADWSPVPFEAFLADDAALARALREVGRRGLAWLEGAGAAPGAVERAVARFGFIRETNYGRLFEVREEAAPTHLAYTAVGLDLHTDNPYRDPEPTLQLLHAIETSAAGGESLFVDGFAHADALRSEAPDRFRLLAETLVEFGYRGRDGSRFTARAPVIETDRAGALKALRLNHRSLVSPAPSSPVAAAWYEAYLDLYERVHAPAARQQRRLEPGDLVIFDNRRILHGRAPYDSQSGRRWLQGCYADRDGLMATLARLEGHMVAP